MSQIAKALIKNVHEYIMISHVRHTTQGGLKLENTHLWLYRGYVFAHNGTIDRSGV
jgi:predicted glutamine amidotransferase